MRTPNEDDIAIDQMRAQQEDVFRSVFSEMEEERLANLWNKVWPTVEMPARVRAVAILAGGIDPREEKK